MAAAAAAVVGDDAAVVAEDAAVVSAGRNSAGSGGAVGGYSVKDCAYPCYHRNSGVRPCVAAAAAAAAEKRFEDFSADSLGSICC